MIKIVAKYNGPVFGVTLTKRDRNNLEKNSYQVVGDYWFDHMRKKHFTPAGAAEYGYVPRSAGYTKQKSRRKGHRDPLRMGRKGQPDSLQASKFAKVKATNKSVTVTLPGLRDFNRRKPKGYPYSLSKEMQMVSEREIVTLQRIKTKHTVAQLKGYRRTKTLTFKG